MEPIVYSKPTVNVELTDSAISKLLERTAEKGLSAIRLGITGGGCGGYEYIFDYNTTSEPSDQVFDFGKFTIHVDSLSRPVKRFFPKESQYFSASWLLVISSCGYVIANIGNVFKKIKFITKPSKKNEISERLIHPFLNLKKVLICFLIPQLAFQ